VFGRERETIAAVLHVSPSREGRHGRVTTSARLQWQCEGTRPHGHSVTLARVEASSSVGELRTWQGPSVPALWFHRYNALTCTSLEGLGSRTKVKPPQRRPQCLVLWPLAGGAVLPADDWAEAGAW